MTQTISLQAVYDSYPEHLEWMDDGFCEGDGERLIFSEAFMHKHLPPSHLVDTPLDAELLDVKTNKCYTVKVYTFYEHTEALDVNYNSVPCWSLQTHMYRNHWCGCHRLQSIEEVGGGVDDPPKECDSDRFVCLWVECGDLVLYSEPDPREKGV